MSQYVRDEGQSHGSECSIVGGEKQVRGGGKGKQASKKVTLGTHLQVLQVSELFLSSI